MGSKMEKHSIEALAFETPELVLLDIMLPGENGLTILKKLKSAAKTKDIPVIMLTAKGSEYDKVIRTDWIQGPTTISPNRLA